MCVRIFTGNRLADGKEKKGKKKERKKERGRLVTVMSVSSLVFDVVAVAQGLRDCDRDCCAAANRDVLRKLRRQGDAVSLILSTFAREKQPRRVTRVRPLRA